MGMAARAVGRSSNVDTTEVYHLAMRPLDELLDPSERGWQLVNEWIASATREVEVLPGAAEAGAKCLSLAWEDMECSYSDWLTWLFTGDLEKFYETSRWSSWRADVAALPCDRGILVYPFPSAEGPAFEERTRGEVPLEELWSLFAA
jgi:Protein of unknown function DUF2625